MKENAGENTKQPDRMFHSGAACTILNHIGAGTFLSPILKELLQTRVIWGIEMSPLRFIVPFTAFGAGCQYLPRIAVLPGAMPHKSETPDGIAAVIAPVKSKALSLKSVNGIKTGQNRYFLRRYFTFFHLFFDFFDIFERFWTFFSGHLCLKAYNIVIYLQLFQDVVVFPPLYSFRCSGI